MKSSEYVKTLLVGGYVVNVGVDDYSQCYFYEYVNENEESVIGSCGTYNFEYEDYIRYILDPDGRVETEEYEL